jgi:hypothetical protein
MLPVSHAMIAHGTVVPTTASPSLPFLSAQRGGISVSVIQLSNAPAMIPADGRFFGRNSMCSSGLRFWPDFYSSKQQGGLAC